jgi:hypothetical protein
MQVVEVEQLLQVGRWLRLLSSMQTRKMGMVQPFCARLHLGPFVDNTDIIHLDMDNKEDIYKMHRAQ